MSFRSALALSRAPLPAFAAVGIFWGAFAAQVPVLKVGIGVGDGAFGLALLCGSTGAISAMWLAPRFDALVGARAMQLGAVLMAVAFLLPGLASGWAFFAVAMFLCAGTSGLLDVVMNARLSQIEARANTGLMSLNHAAFSFAYAASALVTGAAREAGIAPFWVFACLGAVTVLLTLRMHSPPETPAPEDESHPAGPGLRRVVFWAGLITLAGFMTENATEAWSALHIERTLGGRAAEGALGPALLGLAMGIGRLMGHFATPRGRERSTIVVAALVSAAGAAIAASAPSPAIAYVGFAILGFGVSVTAPLAFAIVGQMVRARDRALAISRTAVLGYFGFFIGPPMMGFVSDGFGLRASFSVIAAVMVLLPLLLLPLRGGRERPASSPRNPAE
jgi:predicted MFS family arabinose efflux permease